MSAQTSFLKLLVLNKILRQAEAVQLNQKYKSDAYAIMRNLLQRGVTKKAILGKLWGDSIGFAYIDPNQIEIQPHVAQMINENFARKNRILLLYQFGDTITAAAVNPADRAAIKTVERMTGRPVSPVFSFLEDIETGINKHYQSTSVFGDHSTKVNIDKLIESGEIVTEAQLQSIAGEQAAADFASEIILLAAKEKSSDIHIEPGENSIRIRFRIDGVLQERIKVEMAMHPTLISCLKLLADLDIAERRKPQDGRISFKLATSTIDIRFSSIPTIFGEKVVLRILGQNTTQEVPHYSTLDFTQRNCDQLEKVNHMPNGIFLVSGPTGSGKTTTLFSLLQSINKPEVNILTIEDPVEYKMPGINQVQVNPAINFDFSAALKFFLRQDPDVILVGEIRDEETARISVQSALTGHLVLATIHTNNALQVITRLLDIGVEPYLVAPSIVGVMAQRLVRKICNTCKEKYLLPEDEAETMFKLNGNRQVTFFRGKGCPQCNNTGYSGRLAIHEIFLLNDHIRGMITKEASMHDIVTCAKKFGFQSLYYDGIKKVLRGLTTIDEINRVTMEDI